jgi:hypothetical protein
MGHCRCCGGSWYTTAGFFGYELCTKCEHLTKKDQKTLRELIWVKNPETKRLMLPDDIDSNLEHYRQIREQFW